MTRYILAFDQGTTSCRSVIIDHNGAVVGMVQREFAQHFPEPGWVEHDPVEIWQTQLTTAKEVLQNNGIRAEEIAAIGITNQRETTVVWNRKTGKPVCNAIVWQDRRTSSFCDSLKTEKTDRLIREKTGLVIDAYFSATKIKWILDNYPVAREQAKNGELCFGTIDTWLLFNLTAGKVHATDSSNASRTMLCNIHSLKWDKELLQLFDIPAVMMPVILNSSEVYGTTSVLDGKTEIPVAGIAGDQQAALFGQLCTKPGMVKNTYGTGCFMLMNTGTNPVPSKNNLLTTIAWTINGQTSYALEGSVFIAGAVVQWMRDSLGIIRSSGEIEALASSVDDNEGVYFVPAFTGLGAPYWNQKAKGTITGLSRGSNAGHIARAALESIAYQTMDVLKAMEADSNIKIRELRVDGGASVNNLLMQFQSDILGTKVVRPVVTETTALGAAYLAGLAAGFWKDTDDLSEHWQMGNCFVPSMSDQTRNNLIEHWEKAINATLSGYD